MNPLPDEALNEIWAHHREDVDATRISGVNFSPAQRDRRILLVEVTRLKEQIRQMDLELIDTAGRLQDCETRH